MLITEFTMGKDIMEVRKKNLRSATHTLIVIITAYLISNLLSLILTSVDFVFPEFLQIEHKKLHLVGHDAAQVLTVMGNAIRCPAHLFSNAEIRQQFRVMLFGNQRQHSVEPSTRKVSQRVEAPWLSLLIVPEEPVEDYKKESAFRRFSANVLLRCSRRPSFSSPPEFRRNTYCYGNHLRVADCGDFADPLVYSKNAVEHLL